MEALVEVHTAEDLEIALDAGAEIIGVNQRDLRDFSMHPEIFAEMIGRIPKRCVKVAESGLFDSLKVKQMGYDAILVGEALSRATDPKKLIANMRNS